MYDEQVFIMDRAGEGARATGALHCLQLADGKELWRFSYTAPGEFDFPARVGHRRSMPSASMPSEHRGTSIVLTAALTRRAGTPIFSAISMATALAGG